MPFGDRGGIFGGGNYHCPDYPVFHVDFEEMRKNVFWRISIEPVRARSLILLERPSVHQ